MRGDLISGWNNNELRPHIVRFLKSSLNRLHSSLPEKIINHINIFANKKGNLQKLNEDLYDSLYASIPAEIRSKMSGAFTQKDIKARALSRAKKIINLIQVNNKDDFISQFGFASIADIGCGDGSITAALGRQLKIFKSDNHGIDIRKSSCLSGFTFLTIDEDPFNPQTGKYEKWIPLADQSKTLVTAIMSLHHIKELDFMLDEINRILITNGYFVVAEHDISMGLSKDNKSPELFTQFLDIVHGLYSCVITQPREETGRQFLTRYYSKYRTKSEWIEKIKNKGFRYVREIIDKKNEMARVWLLFRKN
ncbi:MAG: methyltransferase domain-containing protein [Nitrososphaerota archaeon]